MFVRSTLLADHLHAFSTRVGGASTGRYATNNLSAKWGDDEAIVDENRRRFAHAAGFAVEGLRLARQVHGCAIANADEVDANALRAIEADALIATAPQLAVGVLTADCVPILLAADGAHVAAVHAGWRGTVAGIAAATVETLVARGASRASLRAAIGPSICVRCFEVGDEVAAQFADAFVDRASGAKPHVDLWEANAAQLVAVGVGRDRIDVLRRCTMHEPEMFYSFRRDGGGIGQMLSVISPAAPPTATRS